MREELLELWRYRDLLRQMVRRELRVRYKNSVLGFLWSIIPPLLQVLVLTLLVRGAFGSKADNYSAYLLCGLIPWTFLETAILDSSLALNTYYPIIKKVYMPREIIPLATVISNFIHFLLGWVVYFAAFMVVARLFGIGTPPLPTMVWFPVIVVVELFLVTGLSLWLSALSLFYDDVRFILQTLFKLLYFVIPVLYIADLVYYSHTMQKYPWLYKLYMLNPITAIITAFRKTLLMPLSPAKLNANYTIHGQDVPAVPLDIPLFIASCLLSVAIAWAGYWYFNRRKWQFVERG